MQINPAPLHLAQAVITGLVVALSIAILGTSAHTLQTYNAHRGSNPWWLPMWPQHFDVNGTKALVATSAVTTALAGVFLIASFVPRIGLKHRHSLRALLSLATVVPSLFLTLGSVIFAHILNQGSPDIDTIQTWTCRYKSYKPMQQNMGIAKNLANTMFASLCHESRFALYGTLTMFILLGMSTGLTVVTWLADKWAARQQRKEGVEGEGRF